MLPTLIRIGHFRVATYGVLVALGYLLGVLWLSSERENMGLEEKVFWNLIYALFFGAVMGGKLLFWAVEWRAIAAGSLHPLRDFRYGFVFFGGFLGSVLAGWVFGRFRPIRYLKLADYFGVALPMGHSVGRLGCLMAGCCAGKPTTVPWGVRFTHPDCLVDPVFLGVKLHPTQVYESISDALIAAFLYRVLRRIQKGEIREGTAFLGYFLLYSAVRFVNEFFRGDDRGGFLWGLSPSQWIAVACILAAGGALARNGLRPAKAGR